MQLLEASSQHCAYPMGCWQVSHQCEPARCNDRKRLSPSAGRPGPILGVEPWAHSILRSHTALPLYSVTLHARNKTLGMWGMWSRSSETPVQTNQRGANPPTPGPHLKPLHPTPPWPRPIAGCTATSVCTKTKKQNICVGLAVNISRRQAIAAVNNLSWHLKSPEKSLFLM